MLSYIEFSEICDRAGIKIPDPTLDIGRELTYLRGACRTIVVHFAQSDFPEFWKKCFFSIISLRPSWILVNRFGNFEGHRFLIGEFNIFIDMLVEKFVSVSQLYDDLYIVSDDGEMIISYSHSMIEDGLVIFVSKIDLASEVIVRLNILGSEFELISIN